MDGVDNGDGLPPLLPLGEPKRPDIFTRLDGIEQLW
jgi:hypothetical protein